MPASPLADAERVLKVLSNPNRLALLRSLQSPTTIGEMTLPPSREDSWGSADRSITRQALARHVAELVALGVVNELASAEGSGARYVVNRARLFAVVDQLREIATVRSTVDPGGATIELESPGTASAASGPHLVLARGVEEGRVFDLAGPGTAWTIGRARTAAISLDYDAYLSGEHAHVLRRQGGFFLADLATNRNGTFLNWRRMVKGGVAALSAGDVIGVGMSLLVFRA